MEKIGDPNPVTGSHPLVAENPLVLHPGFDLLVISVKAVRLAYTKGLRNPSGLFPAAMSSSLMSDIRLVMIGEAQEVPSAPSTNPPLKTSTF